jgi:hypothetical protein
MARARLGGCGVRRYGADMAASRKLMLASITKDLVSKMLRELGRDVSGAIRAALPDGCGYLVILDLDGTTAFFTDAEKDATVRRLRTVLEMLEPSKP